ncbi:MAG: gamma-glutamyltransferase [Halofilum sp. (in: g-proteobacteria)]|nr:gamma-glutamyltransferase [Halofilum sp. (in: g-proteobacteria)]
MNILNGMGGLHTLDDFSHAAGEYVDPISTKFRDYRVWECPPNGQGIIALLMLNIIGKAEIADEPLSPERIHLEIEAMRLAYAQRDAFVADPKHGHVPVDEILSDAHADQLRDQIDPDRAGKPGATALPRAHEDTVYVSVVDGDGNSASFINSLFMPYGTGLLAPKSGVLLHCRGISFNLEEGHPNTIAPLKRPMHTIIPGMLSDSGRIRMPFGVMGGHYQALGHAQLLTRLIDYGCDLQKAVDLPQILPPDGRSEC